MKDLAITGIIESSDKHKEDILLCHKGDYKFCPSIGVGIGDYINSVNSELLQSIKHEFEKDNMVINKIGIQKDKINIDASY